MHPFHRLAELTEDWQFLIRRDGVHSALPAVTLEIARLPYRHLRFRILACSLFEPLPELQPKIPLDIYPFEPSHLEMVRSIDRPSEARLCERRLRKGQQGLVAFHKSQIAGYAWGCFPVDWELERVVLQIDPGDILCSDVYTAPALRGKGVQTALTLRRFQHFSELGFRRAICYIEIHNAPSLAVWQRKLGARATGEIDFLRIGPWYRARCTQYPATREPSAIAEKCVAELPDSSGASR